MINALLIVLFILGVLLVVERILKIVNLAMDVSAASVIFKSSMEKHKSVKEKKGKEAQIGFAVNNKK